MRAGFGVVWCLVAQVQKLPTGGPNADKAYARSDGIMLLNVGVSGGWAVGSGGCAHPGWRDGACREWEADGWW